MDFSIASMLGPILPGCLPLVCSMSEALAIRLRLARTTLHRQLTLPVLLLYRSRISFIAMGVSLLLLTAWVSDGAIKTEVPEEVAPLQRLKQKSHQVILVLPYVGSRAFADFTEEDVSLKSENWFVHARDGANLPNIVKGAQLAEADLRGFSGGRAFLMKAELRRANLQKADLTAAELKEADLSGAQLQEANLRRANLQKADLTTAQLQGANLTHAQLQKADLGAAQLQGADLTFAQLQKATLILAQLQGADLTFAQLQGADLGDAQLQKATLIDAQLQEATLIGTQLQGANLTHAQLQKATLIGASLKGAILMGARLDGANVKDANLERAKHLTQAQLNQACVTATTKLPRGLKRPLPCLSEQ